MTVARVGGARCGNQSREGGGGGGDGGRRGGPRSCGSKLLLLLLLLLQIARLVKDERESGDNARPGATSTAVRGLLRDMRPRQGLGS